MLHMSDGVGGFHLGGMGTMGFRDSVALDE